MLALIDIDLSHFKYDIFELKKMSNSINRIDNEAKKINELFNKDIETELQPSKDSPHHYYNRCKRVNHFELLYKLKKQRLFIIKNTSGNTQKIMLDNFKTFALSQIIEYYKENI